MVDEISQKIQELNALLAGHLPFAIGYYDPRKLRLLETNAHYMPNDRFASLVNNIKSDKALASVPLVYAAETPDAPLVLSGNHRVQASIAAGVERILCLAITQVKSVEEQVAIQLSHNALVGHDDMQTLKKLYESVRTMDLKAYSGLDEATVKQLEQIKFQAISEPRLTFKTATFLFLPAEQQELQNLIGQVEKHLNDSMAHAFQVRDYQEFFGLLVDAKKDLQIKNSGLAILELMRAGARSLKQQKQLEDSDAANA